MDILDDGFILLSSIIEELEIYLFIGWVLSWGSLLLKGLKQQLRLIFIFKYKQIYLNINKYIYLIFMDQLEKMYNSIIKQMYILDNRSKMKQSLILLKKKYKIK